VNEEIKNMNENIILKIIGLKTYFYTEFGVVKAVDGVDIDVKTKSILGIVGESGCGKSVTSLSILQLIFPPGKIIDGQILLNRENGNVIDILKLHPDSLEMRSIRNKDIAMIFQEPMSAFSPVYTIGEQIIDGLMVDGKMSMEEARKKAIEILERVRIPNAKQRIDEYPWQLSGGLRQRAMIGMALSRNPKILIADEPTTALDVSIQAQILLLIKELQAELGMSVILITHDLGVVAQLADEIIVMYVGKVVESAETKKIFSNPKHPYTIGLLNSIPLLGPKVKEWLKPIQGSPPNPYSLPEGCYFSPRCEYVTNKCKEEPPIVEVEEGHKVKCWLYV